MNTGKSWSQGLSGQAPGLPAQWVWSRATSTGHSSLVVEEPLALGGPDDGADLLEGRAPGGDQRVAALGERRPQLGPDRRADLLARRVEDGQLLLGQVVVDGLAQLLDRVVEGLRVGALELEDGDQRLVALRVLLLPVLLPRAP